MAQSACINQKQPPWQNHPSLNFSRLPITPGTDSLPLEKITRQTGIFGMATCAIWLGTR